MTFIPGPIGQTTYLGLWVETRFVGLRLWRWYFKLRDVRCHPLLFSEREGFAYRRLLRVGSWEFGVRS